MSDKWQDSKYLLKDQYRNADKLNARIRLHAEFSTNDYGWFRWVFDQYDFLENARILELGCGPGDLWRENGHRIPSGWEITLSDFSPGMLDQARGNLAAQLQPFHFEVIDAQVIPYGENHFDALIANHCLYHIPDRQKAFYEIRRVLKPGGRFCATTSGRLHLEEMRALVLGFDPSSEDNFSTQGNPFTLENGGSQLESWFANIHVTRYPDAFHVTEAAPLVDYIFSSSRLGLAEERRAAFRRYLEAQIEANEGVFKIKKDSGIFLAQAL